MITITLTSGETLVLLLLIVVFLGVYVSLTEVQARGAMQKG